MGTHVETAEPGRERGPWLGLKARAMLCRRELAGEETVPAKAHGCQHAETVRPEAERGVQAGTSERRGRA